MQELAKMARFWPPETSAIIGKDYGRETPVKSLRQAITEYAKLKAKAISKSAVAQWNDEDNRIEALAVIGVCIIVGLCLWTLMHVMPDAIDGLIDHQLQVVAESRGVQNAK